MASMNRNVNLEEVNTDAFMGISYLNYQSMLQKVVFIGHCYWNRNQSCRNFFIRD